MLRKVLLISIFLVAGTANAAISISSGGQSYSQNFDTLTTLTTPATAWANDSTLAGWSLFNSTGAAISTYLGNDGSSNTGSFYSYGTAGSADRALGGLGSAAAYFGTPASGAIAGYIAASFTNVSGSTLSGFTLGFDGEQWRNGGNTTAQSMVMEYGFGSSFSSVSTWNAPGANFDWASVVNTATAAAVNGNTAGLVSGKGGTINTTWNSGDTLWVRWIERNDVGNDHGLAIDNFSLIASGVSVSAVPESDSLTMVLLGLSFMGLISRRKL